MSFSDFESDLTELSSDEEEYIPASQKRKKAPVKGKADYKVQNALRPPRTTQYTARSLYDQMMDDMIDLDPEYQRDVVWPETKQIGLIDSILRNYYIPPVIFAVIAQDDGTEKRTCIDGKQRLTSIRMFMDGLICHRDSLTNKRYWYKNNADPKRVLLPKQYVQAFANKQITCVEYDSLTDDQEREIFQRVQLGVALTPAERMQANSGPRASLIREIQSKVLGDEGFGNHMDWGHTRGRDFQCLASIVYLIDRHPSQAFPGAAQLDKWLQPTSTITAKFRNEVMETFKIFVALVRDKKYNSAFQKPTRVSPIEITMIGFLIYLHRNKLSMMQLSSAVWKMRADVRAKHIDIRANGKVTRTMFTFITKGMKSADLKSDGRGDTPASNAIKAGAEPPRRLQKRKRVESSGDEEDEEVQKRPPQKQSMSRATVSKAAEVSRSRQSAQGRDTAKTALSSIATSSKSASGSKAPVKSTTAKSVPGFSSARASKVVAPAVPPGSSSSRHVAARTAPSTSQLKRATLVSMQSNQSTALQKTSPTPVPATSLTLPRRSPAGYAPKTGRDLKSSDVDQPPSLFVKSEPGVESMKTDQNAAAARTGLINTSPVDRLASLRAAKASVNADPIFSPTNANVPSSQSPTSPSVPSYQPPASSVPPTQDISNSAIPIVKSERPQLLCIDTNLSRDEVPPSPAVPQTGASPDPNPTVSEGTQIDQASIEKILALHGIGKFTRPAEPTPQGPAEARPEATSLQSTQLPTPPPPSVPITGTSSISDPSAQSLPAPVPTATIPTSTAAQCPAPQQTTTTPTVPATRPLSDSEASVAALPPSTVHTTRLHTEVVPQVLGQSQGQPPPTSLSANHSSLPDHPNSINKANSADLPIAKPQQIMFGQPSFGTPPSAQTQPCPAPTPVLLLSSSSQIQPRLPSTPLPLLSPSAPHQPSLPPTPLPPLPPQPAASASTSTSIVAQRMSISPERTRDARVGYASSSSSLEEGGNVVTVTEMWTDTGSGIGTETGREIGTPAGTGAELEVGTGEDAIQESGIEIGGEVEMTGTGERGGNFFTHGGAVHISQGSSTMSTS